MGKCDICGRSGAQINCVHHYCYVCGHTSNYCDSCSRLKSNPYLAVWNYQGNNVEVDSDECWRTFIEKQAQSIWEVKFSTSFDRLRGSMSLADLNDRSIQAAARIYQDPDLFISAWDLYTKEVGMMMWRSLKAKMEQGWRPFATNLQNAGRIEDAIAAYEFWGDNSEAGRLRQTLKEKSDGSGKPFAFCPYCREALDRPKTPKYCPHCKEQLGK